MDVVGVKILVLVLLASLKVFSGLLPMFLSRIFKKRGMQWMEYAMSGVMCLGGGVLLATVFVHMLPEIRDMIEIALVENGKSPHKPGDFSLAELVLCSGFFFVYLAETLVQKIFHLKHSHSHGLPTSEAPEIQSNGYSHHTHNDHSKEAEANTSFSDVEKMKQKSEKIKEKSEKSAKAKEKKLLSSIRSFVIVLALSIHSIFEGMAIGLQVNSSDVWMLFMAVAIHESAILFCVGNEMVNNGMARVKILLYILTLGFITPIGTIVGIVLTLNSSEAVGQPQSIVVGVLQGLAAGTLLYITFYEVLEREKLEKIGMTGIVGCSLIILGFAFMTGLTALGSHFGQVDETTDNSTLFTTMLPFTTGL